MEETDEALNLFREAVIERLDIADHADEVQGNSIEEIYASANETAKAHSRGSTGPVSIARKAIENAETHEQAALGQLALKNAKRQAWVNELFGEGD